MQTICDGVVFITDLEDMPLEEMRAYIERGRERIALVKLEKVTVNNAGNGEVDVSYEYARTDFQRIRRITGYLVGTLDRFNDAKRKEVEDRVKHEITDDCEDVYVDDKV